MEWCLGARFNLRMCNVFAMLCNFIACSRGRPPGDGPRTAAWSRPENSSVRSLTALVLSSNQEAHTPLITLDLVAPINSNLIEDVFRRCSSSHGFNCSVPTVPTSGQNTCSRVTCTQPSSLSDVHFHARDKIVSRGQTLPCHCLPGAPSAAIYLRLNTRYSDVHIFWNMIMSLIIWFLGKTLTSGIRPGVPVSEPSLL